MTQPTTDEATPPTGPNAIVVSPPGQSPAYRYSLAAKLAAFVTPALALLAFLLDPKDGKLSVLILGFGLPLTTLLNSLHGDAVKAVALDAAQQAANRAPGDAGPKNGEQPCS